MTDDSLIKRGDAVQSNGHVCAKRCVSSSSRAVSFTTTNTDLQPTLRYQPDRNQDMARWREDRGFVGAFAEITEQRAVRPAPGEASKATAPHRTRRDQRSTNKTSTAAHKTLPSPLLGTSTEIKEASLNACGGAAVDRLESIREARDDDVGCDGTSPLLDKEDDSARAVHFENAPRSPTGPQRERYGSRHRRRWPRLLCFWR